MEFVITTDQILLICALITSIWGVWKIVKELKKPNEDIKNLVDKHSQLLDNDNQRLKEVEQSNQMILKSLSSIINHEITGNGIEKMKAIRDELQDYLINR